MSAVWLASYTNSWSKWIQTVLREKLQKAHPESTTSRSCLKADRARAEKHLQTIIAPPFQRLLWPVLTARPRNIITSKSTSGLNGVSGTILNTATNTSTVYQDWTDWGCSTGKWWGHWTEGRRCEKNGENCVMRSLIICKPSLYLVQCCYYIKKDKKAETLGQRMRKEMYTKNRWKPADTTQKIWAQVGG